MKAQQRVLELLYDRGGLCTLEELAAAAHLSPAQLDRALSAIEAVGQCLERSPAHGVGLVHPMALNAVLIERELGTRRIGRNVIVFPEVDSTNDTAFDAARVPGADGMVVLAESQRAGRGRLGRRWVSPPGANILLSMLVDLSAGDLAQEAMTIAAGVAVASAVDDLTGLDCRLKWPNDLLLDGAKLAGILVETRRVGRARFMVIGIGANANAAPPADAVGRPATCLADHADGPIERIELVRGILQRLDEWMMELTGPAIHGTRVRTDTPRTAAIDRLHAEWLARCDMINTRLAVQAGARRYEGRVLDVSPLEGLLLVTDNGQTVHLPAANATIVD